MSNYNARQRAIRAERAALKCQELVHKMRDACYSWKRSERERMEVEFQLKHAHMQQQMDHLLENAVALTRAKALTPFAAP